MSILRDCRRMALKKANIQHVRLTDFRLEAIFNQMVERSATRLDEIFHALSDPTRRAMVRRLATDERSIGELAAPHRMSFAAAAKHVKVLERAGILRRKIVGRTHQCRIEPRALSSAHRWFQHYRHFWTARLDSLGAMLDSEDRAAARKLRIKRTRRR